MTLYGPSVIFLHVKDKLPLSRIILACALFVVVVSVLVLLSLWTVRIASQKRSDELMREIENVTAQGGESALLALAGYQVDNIFHSDEGLILFEEGNQNWKYSADELQNITVYERCAPSVVEIYVSSDLSQSTGCGVIISSSGYIVTNTHVVSQDGVITVRFHDGTQAEATLVGSDPITDIAVICVEVTAPLTPVSLLSADELVVGQKIIAIGSPYGYSWSQSVGTVSALERTVTSSTGVSLSGLIQTDAQINPGNSGGPLLDSRGNMVGLVTAIYSTSGSSQGVSFAIPVDTVVDVAGSLIRDGRVSRGTLDILSVELNPMIVDYAGLPVSEGILISQVVPAGEADRAGLRGGNTRVAYGNSVIYLGGDIITALDGVPVTGYNDYYAFMADTASTDRVDVTVVRDGQTLTVNNVQLVEQTVENMRWLVR